jgi:hypothetical protein
MGMENHGGMTSTGKSDSSVHQSSLEILPAVICDKAGGHGKGNDEFVL